MSTSLYSVIPPVRTAAPGLQPSDAAAPAPVARTSSSSTHPAAAAAAAAAGEGSVLGSVGAGPSRSGSEAAGTSSGGFGHEASWLAPSAETDPDVSTIARLAGPQRQPPRCLGEGDRRDVEHAHRAPTERVNAFFGGGMGSYSLSRAQ